MYRSDLMFWVLNLLDIAKTGEINGNIDQIKHPKRKVDKSKLRKYSMMNGDTFGRNGGIVPIRWSDVFARPKPKAEEVDRFDLMRDKLRAQTKKNIPIPKPHEQPDT